MERRVHAFDVPVVSESASCAAVAVAMLSVKRGVVVPNPRLPDVESQVKVVDACAVPNLTVDDAERPPVKRMSVEVELAFEPKLVVGVNSKGDPPRDASERQLPLTAKQPAARLIPPVPYSEDVAVVRLATPCTEKREPGVVVPTPTLPAFVITKSVLLDEPTENSGPAPTPFGLTLRSAQGDDDAMPTDPPPVAKNALEVAVSVPPKNPVPRTYSLPCVARLAEGEVVPRPNFPAEFITEVRFPAVS